MATHAATAAACDTTTTTSSETATTNITASIAVTTDDLASISGTTVAGLLSLKSYTPLSDSFPKNLLKNTDTYATLTTGDCYLNTVDSDGSIIYTGTTTTIESDGTCTFSDVEINTTYVIEAEAIGYDSQGNTNILTQSTIAMPQTAGIDESVSISDTTSVIVTSLISGALETITNLDDLDEATVTAVVSAITTALESAINSGVISVSSSVETYSGQDQTRVANAEVEMDDKDKEHYTYLANNDETLSNVLQQYEYQASMNDEDFNLKDAEEFIEKIFGVTETSRTTETDRTHDDGGNDIPDFIITEFAEAYLADIRASVIEIANGYLIAGNMDSIVPSINLATAMVTAVSEHLTTLNAYYSADTVDYDMLDEFDDIGAILAVFTLDRVTELANLDVNTRLTVPEVIIMMNTLDLMGDELNTDLFDTASITAIYEDTSTDESTYSLMDSFDPIVFSTEIGFLNMNSVQTEVNIEHFEVRPMDYWSDDDGDGSWTETTVLGAWVDIVGFGLSETDIDSVVLTYTKLSDGTVGTASLVT